MQGVSIQGYGAEVTDFPRCWLLCAPKVWECSRTSSPEGKGPLLPACGRGSAAELAGDPDEGTSLKGVTWSEGAARPPRKGQRLGAWLWGAVRPGREPRSSAVCAVGAASTFIQAPEGAWGAFGRVRRSGLCPARRGDLAGFRVSEKIGNCVEDSRISAVKRPEGLVVPDKLHCLS